MAYNALDQALIRKYEENGGGLKGRVKTFGNIGKAVGGGVKDAVKKGGKAVSEYFKDKVSAKKALSAATYPSRKAKETLKSLNPKKRKPSESVKELSIRLANEKK